MGFQKLISAYGLFSVKDLFPEIKEKIMGWAHRIDMQKQNPPRGGG
jgi:hypothetical protein